MIRYNVEVEYENSGYSLPGLTLIELKETLANIQPELLVKLSIKRIGGVY